MHPVAHQNKPTPQQAATQDPISQQTHPLQPDMSHPLLLRVRMTPHK